MTNNLNTISGVDRIQAAAIVISARQKAKEVAEQAAAHTSAFKRNNSMERTVVMEALKLHTEAGLMAVAQTEASCTTQGLEAEQSLVTSTEPPTPTPVPAKTLAAQPPHILPEPTLLPNLDVDGGPTYEEDLDDPELEPGQGAIGYIPIQVWNPYTNDFILDNRMIQETRDGKVRKETRHRAFGTKQATEPIPANAKLFRCYVAEDMEEAQPIRFLVPDMVMAGGVGLIWGKSGSGKTAFLLDLVLSVATGNEFAGRATQQCDVLYAALEGGHGFRQRLLVGARHKGLDLGRRVRVCHDPLNIGNDDDVNGLALYALQNDCKLIVIDTLSASLAGELSENSNDDMALVVRKLYRLQRQTGASILLVHHSGHDGSNERGASALRCNVDTSIRISTSGGHRKWTVIKQKDGSDGASALFDLSEIEVTRKDGETVGSIVVKHLKSSSEAEGAKKMPKGPRLKGNPALAMDKFSREWAARSAGLSQDQIAVLTIAWKDAKEFCRPLMQSKDPERQEDRAAEALARLVELGLLESQFGKSLRLAQTQ